MNWELAKAKLNQAKGKAQKQKMKHTDEDIDVIYGHREEFVGRIQERYGIQKEEAEVQVSDWENNYKEQ